jgi:hypothetical protein
MEKPGDTIVSRIIPLNHISLEANPPDFSGGFFLLISILFVQIVIIRVWQA